MSAPVRTRRTSILGARDEVEAALRTLYVRGELVRVDSVEMLPGNRAKVNATVAVTALAQQEPARRVRRSRVQVVLLSTAGTVALGAAGLTAWFAVQVVRWIIQNWAAFLGIAGLALLLLFVILPRAGVCPGIHCPGCRHRP